ncbi:MAG TPA: cupredoxin domain-containing protein [Afifellaceae bacterium]|nr:cupredoxin domain-containing protein [Afifellaceae bacterium]
MDSHIHTAAMTAAALALIVIGAASMAMQAQAEERFFTVTAIEPKGGVTIDQEPFPGRSLPEGGGYVIKEPDGNGRWEVSAYVWAPAQIVVDQGDEVTLEFVGINGASHPTTIKGLGQSFDLKRGTATRVSFVAGEPGVFPIECDTHRPSMRAEIVVLPRS